MFDIKMYKGTTKMTQPTLTQAQRDTYWETGYLVLRSLFTSEETTAWRAESDRLLKSDIVHPDNVRTPFRFNSTHSPERIDPLLDISPVFADLCRDERIVGAVRDLFGDDPLLFKDKLILKLPGTSGYTLHQDQAWWQLCPADDILSVSVALDAATESNGAVAVYPGYHKSLITPEGMKTNLRDAEAGIVDPAKRHLIETQPGDVLIFHSLTPHDSAANTSDKPRRSLYLSYNAARSGDLRDRYYGEYSAIKNPQQYFK